MPYDVPSTLKGVRFPFVVSGVSGGSIATEEKAQIESCIKMLLVTEVGSRLMLRDYGVGLSLILQEPNDEVAQNLFRRLAFEGITRWEPRVMITNMTFKTEEEILHIYLEYQLLVNGESITADFAFPVA